MLARALELLYALAKYSPDAQFLSNHMRYLLMIRFGEHLLGAAVHIGPLAVCHDLLNNQNK